MTRPTFAETIKALRCQPTPEEADAADALEVLETYHQGDSDETTDDASHYGDCTGCRELWPCPSWVWGEQLAVLWLGRGYDRYWAHAKPVIDQLNTNDRSREEVRYGPRRPHPDTTERSA